MDENGFYLHDVVMCFQELEKRGLKTAGSSSRRIVKSFSSPLGRESSVILG